MQNLRVRLLGGLQVDGCDPSDLGRRQVRTLLKVLALHHDRPVSTDQLTEWLWGDQPPAGAVEQISVLVSRLRRVVGGERITRSDAGYALAVDWLDLDALGDYAQEAEQRLEQGSIGASRAAAAAGLALVRGPLLADELDPWWAGAERSASDVLAERLRHTATEAAVAVGDWTAAISWSNALLDTDPYDEVALRSLMTALAQTGRAASALAAFASARTRLGEDLGVDPSPATESLHTAILLGELPSASDGDTQVSRPRLPGRADAWAELDGLLERARGGRGTVGLVVGDAGSGKTRLLQDWSSPLADSETIVVRIDAQDRARSLPLQPVLDVVAELVSRQGSRNPGDVLGLEGTILGPLVGFQTEPSDSAQLAALFDPDAGQTLLFGALVGFFRRIAQEALLVVVLDDAHLADAATLAWLVHAGRQLATSRILLVGAGRAEEVAPWPGAVTISLGPLDLAAVTLVVGEERAADLHERSGGNALFLTELAAAPDGVELPDSIRRAVEARCERAGPAGPTLRAAAVIGPGIDLDLLSAVTGTPTGELLDHLEVGVARKFLVEEGAQFRFTHALVQQALAGTVGVARTALIHRSVARALVARPQPEAEPLEVAHYARLGGDLPQASTMLVAAARQAVARFDQTRALELLDDAIGLDDTAAARLERARVHSMLAHHAEAREDIKAALERGAGTEALEVAAWAAHFERDFAEALALADRGAREAIDADVRSSCLALGGWISLATGDLGGAEERLEAAGAAGHGAGGAGHGVGGESAGGLATAWMAWLRTAQGRPAEALSLARPQRGQGLSVYRFPNAYGLMATVTGRAMLGRADEALVALDELAVEVEQMGATRWVPRPLNLRGWITRNLGEAAAADELNQAAREAAEAAGQVEPLANALLDLAAGRLFEGDLAHVGPLLEEARALLEVEHAFHWRHGLRGRLLQARLDLAAGDAVAARHGALALAADALTMGVPRYEVQAGLVAAVAGVRSGERVHQADLEAVQGLLTRLDQVAGLESWWITAEVARAFGVDAWEALARQRVAELRTHAGRLGPSLERAASRRLA